MSVPPGASYQASNTYLKLKRRLQRLEDPVRIQFRRGWERGNPLYDWYHRRSSHLIKSMQLRREGDAPFFHEYVVFELYNGGGFFRIDRRQHPDEKVPLDCIYERGVEAYDTIEEVTSLEDSPYSTSDCLSEIKIDLEGSFNVELCLILKTLWAIHWNASSRIYTLQRYNCYFVARTVFLLAARGGHGFSGQDANPEDSDGERLDID